MRLCRFLVLEEKEKEFLLCSSAPVRRAGKLPPPLSTKWISHHHKFPKSLLQLLPRQELCSQTSPHFSLGSSLFLGGFRGVFLLLGLKTSPYSPSSHVPTWTFLDQERGFFPLLDALLGTHQFPAQPQGMPGLSASPVPGGAGFVPSRAHPPQTLQALEMAAVLFNWHHYLR